MSFVGVLHLRFYVLASTPGKQIFENQMSVILKDKQNRIHSRNIECAEMQQSSKQRSPIKIKEGNDRQLTSQPVSNVSGSLLPMKQRCQDNWWQKLFLSSNDDVAKCWPELGTPLCSALGRKHWKCIYNWTVAHYTVTSYRDLLFSSRDKVSVPAREYNCLLLLSVHERLLSLLWLQPRYSHIWNWVECHRCEWISHTRVC